MNDQPNDRPGARGKSEEMEPTVDNVTSSKTADKTVGKPAAKLDGAPETADGKPAKSGDSFGEFVRTIIYALLIALGIRTVAYEPFNIPSESMLPTLMVGDYLFVSKYAYGYSRHSLPFSLPLFSGRVLASDVERGDVVVFKLPRDGRTDYIKRIVGLPGDSVQLRSGLLYINGEAVRRERIEDFVFRETPNTNCRDWSQYRVTEADGSVSCRYPQFRETLPNGVSYLTLDLDNRHAYDTTRIYKVPDGQYFVMGDNRDNSLDSRRPMSVGVGSVPAENLVGRAEVIFFSTDGGARLWEPWRWFSSVRAGRFFNSLR